MGELTVKNLHAETEKKVMAYVKWRSVFYSSRELANSNPQANELTQMNIKNEWDATGTAHKYDPRWCRYAVDETHNVGYYRFGQVRNL